MVQKSIYVSLLQASAASQRQLAVLIDPEKFDLSRTSEFLRGLPSRVNYLFVGGSTVPEGMTEKLVEVLKLYSAKPILIFPGHHEQITDKADALLFLSLLSGRNPEYLIGQQVKSVGKLRSISIEVISTGYLLIDGGNQSAVARVTQTQPLLQSDVNGIVDTAKAGQYLGAQLIYLEAGSGAKNPVAPHIIAAVKKELDIPLIVGGGIRTSQALKEAYDAGADLVVIGTVLEEDQSFINQLN